LIVKVNKINSHNSLPSYHKSLPLYRRRPNNRSKNILPGESGKISSKELDPETGFYYYGARYLDPRTSRWLSGDPALGEYLPAAPVSDEAKKGNGNLPGQGGVFNLVNLHVYHYAGNNPVKYVDPDGRDSGYAVDENGAFNLSHTGIFMGLEGGRYAFFEVTGLGGGRKVGQPQTDNERDKNSEILSTSPLSVPTPKSGQTFLGTPNGGVVRRDFDSYDDMMGYLFDSETGKGGYDKIIHFKTNSEQDAKILEAATNLGGNFSAYHLTKNQCGLWGEKVLTSPGTGIGSSNERSILPKIIGNNLLLSNPRISWSEKPKK
jgi:RHS repeat-associated protein